MQENEQTAAGGGNASAPSGRAAIGIVFLSFFLLLAVQYALWKAGLAGEKESFLAEAVIMLPACLYLWRKKISPGAAFRIRLPKFAVILASFMIGLGILVLSDGFDRLAGIFLPESDSLRVIEEEMRKALSADSPLDWLLIVLTVVVMAGLFEEMLFRGFLQRTLEREQEITRAVLTSAFIFAFFHYIWLIWPWAFIQFLVIGVIMGVAAWKSDSFLPAAIIHLINNSAVLMFLNAGDVELPWYEWRGQVAPWILPFALWLTWFGFRVLYRAMESESDHSGGKYIDTRA